MHGLFKTRKSLPRGWQSRSDADRKMMFDRFHITRHVVEAVDTVRKREHPVTQQL